MKKKGKRWWSYSIQKKKNPGGVNISNMIDRKNSRLSSHIHTSAQLQWWSFSWYATWCHRTPLSIDVWILSTMGIIPTLLVLYYSIFFGSYVFFFSSLPPLNVILSFFLCVCAMDRFWNEESIGHQKWASKSNTRSSHSWIKSPFIVIYCYS